MQRVAKLHPILQRPVFLFAPAAGMERNNWPRAVAQKFGRDLSILRRNKNLGSESAHLDANLRERTRELGGSMFGVGQFSGPENKIFYSAPPQLCLKNAIGIIKITHDQIE